MDFEFIGTQSGVIAEKPFSMANRTKDEAEISFTKDRIILEEIILGIFERNNNSVYGDMPLKLIILCFEF